MKILNFFPLFSIATILFANFGCAFSLFDPLQTISAFEKYENKFRQYPKTELQFDFDRLDRILSETLRSRQVSAWKWNDNKVESKEDDDEEERNLQDLRTKFATSKFAIKTTFDRSAAARAAEVRYRCEKYSEPNIENRKESNDILPKLRQICAYLGDHLLDDDDDDDDDEDAEPMISWTDEQIIAANIRALASDYAQLDPLVYRGVRYEGEDAINRLLRSIDDDARRRKIWRRWRTIVARKMATRFGAITRLLQRKAKNSNAKNGISQGERMD